RHFGQRTFEPVKATGFELAKHIACGAFGEPPVAIDEQSSPRTDGRAHRGHALYPGSDKLLADRRPNVVRDNVVERRDLDCIETGVSRFAGTFGEPRRASVQRSAIDVGVKLDRVSAALPERVGKRLGYALGRNVP